MMRGSRFGVPLACIFIAAFAPSLPIYLQAGSARASSEKPWCGQPFVTSNSQVSAITGTLTQQLVWGPPNFGETPKKDARYEIWILKLDYLLPIDADLDLNLSVRKIKISTVQLVGTKARGQTYDEFVHRHIVVMGRLRTQIFPGDYTPITIEVESVRLSDRIMCDGRAMTKT